MRLQDVPRRNVLPSQLQFSAGDSIAIVAAGFAGRIINVEVSEERRGRLRTWTEQVRPPRVVRNNVGIQFHEQFGQMQPMRTERIDKVEDDVVFRIDSINPGSYLVRLTSNGGHQLQTHFTVGR